MSTTIKVTNDVKLVKRPRSQFWQAAIKDPEGVWRRKSTGTSDEAKAREIALEQHAEMNVKHKHGLPIVKTQRFDAIADKYVARLQKIIEDGGASINQEKYPAIVENWLKPFFGSYAMNAINQDVLAQFDQWRTKKHGKELSRGTISKQKDVLNAIFEFAVDQKYCKRSDVPKLTVKGKGRPAQRRGHFTVQEFNDLMQFMRSWEKEPRQYISRYLRGVLRAYVEFLCLTGMRPGEEVLKLKWGDFERVERNDKPPVYRVYVRYGKTKNRRDDPEHSIREVLISELAYQSLETLKTFHEDVINHLDDQEAWFKDRLVFALPDGSEIKRERFPEMFKKLMIASGMKIGKDGKNRTLYSLRHTYATWKLERKEISYERLSRQLGTSVVMLEQHYDHVVADSEIDDLIV